MRLHHTGTRIMLVTCHLAAHSENVDKRNADYARIAAGLFKAGAAPGSVHTDASVAEGEFVGAAARVTSR